MTKTVTVKCFTCGKEFEKLAKEHARSIQRGRLEFCSYSCAGLYGSKAREKKLGSIALSSGNKRDQYTPFRYFARRSKSSRARYKFHLDLEYLKELWESQGGICPLTGWKIELPIGTVGFRIKHNSHNASLDRIDNSKDYVEGNVRYVALIANLARNNWDDKEVIEFARSVVQQHKK